MPQLILPLIPPGTTIISNLLSVYRDENRWTYLHGCHPIFSHQPKDHRMFRFITSQMIDSGSCRHRDIIKTFGIPKSNVNRNLKQLREEGIDGFFKERQGRRGGAVLTAEVLEKAQQLLDKGSSPKTTAEELDILYDTFRKAIKDGRLRKQAGVVEKIAQANHRAL